MVGIGPVCFVLHAWNCHQLSLLNAFRPLDDAFISSLAGHADVTLIFFLPIITSFRRQYYGLTLWSAGRLVRVIRSVLLLLNITLNTTSLPNTDAQLVGHAGSGSLFRYRRRHQSRLGWMSPTGLPVTIWAAFVWPRRNHHWFHWIGQTIDHFTPERLVRPSPDAWWRSPMFHHRLD